MAVRGMAGVLENPDGQKALRHQQRPCAERRSETVAACTHAGCSVTAAAVVRAYRGDGHRKAEFGNPAMSAL